MNKYAINILWSEEDGEYVATCPAFPGLSALGETEEEALAEAKVALGLFIKTCEERGIPLPEPEIEQEYSGQFRVRLSKQDHRRAVQMAARQNISLNQLVANAVAGTLGASDLYERFASDMRQMIQDMEERLTKQTTQHGYKLAASLANYWEQTQRISGVVAPPRPYQRLQLTAEAISTGETPASFDDLLSLIRQQQKM
jgi:antitoxin HicB